MVATIIIPAHNEESVLGSTLQYLLDDLSEDVQVVVVCNGCTDRTAEVAQRFGLPVEVLRVEPASKIAALNAGDGVARSFPRVYLDADIRISGTHMQRVIAALSAPGALAAEPKARMITSNSTVWVKAYYAVWQALHGQDPGDVGCGLYALSEAGRSRFAEFPQVISDDGFTRAQFAPDEIIEVQDAYTVIETPRNLNALTKIKARSRIGVLELTRKYPELWARKRSGTRSLLSKVLGVPLRLWPLFPFYLMVQLSTRRRARRIVRDLDRYRWERDETTR
ncbi:MAG: glycosyltransferase [Acidimicrobiia bacterium]|nr:glycosyltransferase [Acidimicrobiia bacterium]MDH3469947.1 glycosyltransferase [Acidimicrobiia bacterium]